MNTTLEILGSVGVGLLGILFYTLVKSIKYFISWNPFVKITPERNEEGSIGKLLGENFGAWLWSFTMISCIAVVAKFAPDTMESLMSLAGLDLVEIGSFFSIGFALSIMVKEAKSKK